MMEGHPLATPCEPAHVRVEGLERRFRRRQILSGASFEIPAGTLAVLIGPNGTGKTTVLRIIAGVLDADGGTVSVCGHAPRTGRSAYVPAGDRGLYWRLSARRNLLFHARLGRPGPRDPSAHIAALAEELGASALLDQRVGSASTGEKRRIALAAGFAPVAPVVLIDEPFADLDDAGRDGFTRLARRWTSAGGIVVCAAPSAADAPSADLSLHLADGRVHA